MWRLEEHGDSAWRLKVVMPETPEVELNATSLRIWLPGGGEPSMFHVPDHAQPIDVDVARCSFSRTRGELVVEWPRTRGCNGFGTAAAAGTASASAAAQGDGAAAGTGDASAEGGAAAVSSAAASSPGANSAAVGSAATCDNAAETEEWRARGNDAVKAGDFEEAIRCYAAGLAGGSGDEAMMRSNRAMCLHKLGRFEEAVEDARRCVALRPDFFKGYVRGAMALRSLGRAEEALVFIRRCPAHEEAGKLVAELKPEAEAAERRRIASLGGAERAKEEGNVLFRKGSFEAALVQYTKAIDLCEDPAGALALALRNNRAACNHQLSDYTAVVADTSFVLDHEPANIKALTRRMLALEPLERFKAALEDARGVLRQDPRNEIANKVQHRVGQQVRKMDAS